MTCMSSLALYIKQTSIHSSLTPQFTYNLLVQKLASHLGNIINIMAGSNKLVMIGVLLAILMIGSVNGIAVCNVDSGDLLACLPSCNGRTPQAPPSSECCSTLKNANLGCLCGHRNNWLLKWMYNVDFQQAMAIPALCHIVDKSWICDQYRTSLSHI